MKKIIILFFSGMMIVLLSTSLSFAEGTYREGINGTGSVIDQKAETVKGSMMHRDTGGHSMVLSQEQVRELQRILDVKGYDVGMVDGIMGTKTENALRNYQMDEGLAVTGNADRATLQSLSSDSETQEFFGVSPEFEDEKILDKPSKDNVLDTQ